MSYVAELKPIEFLPKEFLEELNAFFINSNLSKEQRKNLVDIIKKNITTFN
jgi:hypothetical protein